MKTLTVLSSLLLALMAGPLQATQIEIEELWLRESVPGAENGAGFGKLRNIGEEDTALVSVAADIADDVEIHQHTHRNGEMVMEQIESLLIPAGETVSLRPGGYHIMLMGLHERLATGESHSLTLHFADGSEQQLQVEVRDLMQQDDQQSHGHGSHRAQ
jgi:periplasmic copper chaperone A